jgi:hypothetical protein
VTEELEFFDELPDRPARGGATTRTRSRVEAVIAAGGKWARWPSKVYGKSLREILAPFGEFEVVDRADGGEMRSYVRYVGPSKVGPSKVAKLLMDAGLAAPPTPSPAAVGPTKVPPNRVDKVGPVHDTWVIECPSCHRKLPVPQHANQAEVAAVKAKHREDRPKCDVELKRRGIEW